MCSRRKQNLRPQASLRAWSVGWIAKLAGTAFPPVSAGSQLPGVSSSSVTPLSHP